MKIGTSVATAVIVASLAIIGTGPVTTAFGQGNMPSGGMMSGMGMGGPFPTSAHPISTVQAEQILREWPAAHHLDGLVLDEVEVYTENIYGQFKEQSTGRGAIQILVDRYSGRAVPEMGPNVMWDTKYGRAMIQAMMDGMGMRYYHFDVMRGGRQVAMLSVNASTGQVWYHTWHGEFLSKHEVGRP